MRRDATETGRITVVGAGAIGGVVGAYLHRAGHDVLLVDESERHVEAIRRDGLRVSGVRGTETFHPPIVRAEELVEDLETVFLCVKAHHTLAALERIAPLLVDGGYVVSLQNGLNEKTIARVVTPERAVGAFVHFGSDLISPGEITLGYEETIHVGELDGEITPRVEKLCAILNDAMPAEPTTEVWGYLWGKLVFAAAGFVVSCVDAPVAEVLDDDAGLHTTRRACSEAYLVARTEAGATKPIGDFDPEAFDPRKPQPEEGERMLRILADTWRSQLKQHMGIWRDLRVRRRKTEADAQLGEILDAATRHGIRTPTIEATLEIIGEIERGEREMSWENLREIPARASSHP